MTLQDTATTPIDGIPGARGAAARRASSDDPSPTFIGS